jgi:acyl carrier protein
MPSLGLAAEAVAEVLLSDEVRTIAASVFGVPESEITPESSPETVEVWDSLKQLYLILALEERFGVEFSPIEIEGISSMGSIVSLLEEKLGAAPRG